MNPRKYLVLAGIVVFGTIGDVLLKRGMQAVGSIPLSDWPRIITSVFNPWVALGILFLLAFFGAYLHALSWADLTYVLPAASVSYILLALLSKYFLGENVTLTRWLGIVLVSFACGFVTRGPEVTHRKPHATPAKAEPAVTSATTPAMEGEA